MLRYPRLYLYFLRFSFSKAFEFRLDFWFRVVMDAFYYVVSVAFYRVIFVHTNLLAGWDEREMMVFVGAYLVVDAVHMSFFSNNLWWLPIYVNRGDLDYYLVRPVSSFFFLTLREFAANSFLNLAMATGFLVWAMSGLESWPPWPRLVVFLVLLLNGAFLYALLHTAALIPVFWTHSARGFGNLFFLFSRIVERPDAMFTGWVRRVLVSVLPFGLMASFPARALLDGATWGLVLHVAGVTAAVFAFVLWLWGRGLRSYASASS